MSKLCASTLVWAFSIAFVMRRCSMGISSSMPSFPRSGEMRSEPKMRMISSSRET